MFKLITFWWLLHSQWLLSLFSILRGGYVPSGFPSRFDTEFVMFVLPTTSIRPFLHISWPWGFSQEISWHPCFFSISPNQTNSYTMTFSSFVDAEGDQSAQCQPSTAAPCGTTSQACATPPPMCGNTSPPPCGTTPGPPPGFIFGSANCCQRKSNDGKNYHLVRLDLFSKHWKMILMNASVSLMTHTWEDVCLQSLAVDQVISI